ncbi:hypothetical protein AZF37_02455 [endosymbiont 'TC1' of Trimyema compressum]|uniref:signal peptidase II n=1 Tax=endosymbiont 'TC1' of Trimyema compressum TaxID=243899 RepID=UPI0007F0811F|nr:signal peptidase II [endosymbiont 'TC1' of Trimyema compressum]AMP20184.1 hypothetical protein AZF37_02455 [endosymbiont 'TC1' of Trimyema compressum]
MWLVVIIVLVLIDQASKFIVGNTMTAGQQIILIPDVFNIRFILNKGAAFGILENAQWLFISLTAIVVIIILIQIRSERKKGHNVIPEAILLGGALGNLIDRLIFGYVRDFLEVPFFAVMNFADWFVSLGIVLVIIKYIFFYKRDKDQFEIEGQE